MADKRKSKPAPKDVQSLKKENNHLKKQVRELLAEHDSYQRALHRWAKDRVSPEDVKKWMAGETVEGSLMTFIAEVDDEQ